MAIQVQVKVLPNPSGEVVRVSAGGRNLVGGTDQDTTVIEIEPGKKMEIEGEVEQRVVFNKEQGAATMVPVSDVDGSISFQKEEEEKKKVVEEDRKKAKEETDKKYKEAKEREDKRLGRKPGEGEQKSAMPQSSVPSGAHVAGNVTDSNQVRGEAKEDHPKKK